MIPTYLMLGTQHTSCTDHRPTSFVLAEMFIVGFLTWGPSLPEISNTNTMVYSIPIEGPRRAFAMLSTEFITIFLIVVAAGMFTEVNTDNLVGI